MSALNDCAMEPTQTISVGRFVKDFNSIANYTTYSSSGNGKFNVKIKLMIFTRYRSGSTFTGELFSHHPDVFYMLEPLTSLVP